MPARRPKVTKRILKDPNAYLSRAFQISLNPAQLSARNLANSLPVVQRSAMNNMKHLALSLPAVSPVNQNKKELNKFRQQLQYNRNQQYRQLLKEAQEESKRYSRLVTALKKVISKKRITKQAPKAMQVNAKPIIQRGIKKTFKPKGGARRIGKSTFCEKGGNLP